MFKLATLILYVQCAVLYFAYIKYWICHAVKEGASLVFTSSAGLYFKNCDNSLCCLTVVFSVGLSLSPISVSLRICFWIPSDIVSGHPLIVSGHPMTSDSLPGLSRVSGDYQRVSSDNSGERLT